MRAPLSLPAPGHLGDPEIQGSRPSGFLLPLPEVSGWREAIGDSGRDPSLCSPRRVTGRGLRIGRRRAQTNRGRGWEYLLFTWKRLGADQARAAPQP